MCRPRTFGRYQYRFHCRFRHSHHHRRKPHLHNRARTRTCHQGTALAFQDRFPGTRHRNRHHRRTPRRRTRGHTHTCRPHRSLLRDNRHCTFHRSHRVHHRLGLHNRARRPGSFQRCKLQARCSHIPRRCRHNRRSRKWIRGRKSHRRMGLRCMPLECRPLLRHRQCHRKGKAGSSGQHMHSHHCKSLHRRRVGYRRQSYKTRPQNNSHQGMATVRSNRGHTGLRHRSLHLHSLVPHKGRKVVRTVGDTPDLARRGSPKAHSCRGRTLRQSTGCHRGMLRHPVRRSQALSHWHQSHTSLLRSQHQPRW